MRSRVAALIAVLGIAAIPGSAYAAEPIGSSTVHVSVVPASGSPTTHFRISFAAVHATGAVDGGNVYRITAGGPQPAGGKCASSTSEVSPPALTGATVHVTLAPAGHKRWCVGTFRGQVWSVLLPPCPVGKACPAILPAPRIVGRFTFRVTRG